MLNSSAALTLIIKTPLELSPWNAGSTKEPAFCFLKKLIIVEYIGTTSDSHLHVRVEMLGVGFGVEVGPLPCRRVEIPNRVRGLRA